MISGKSYKFLHPSPVSSVFNKVVRSLEGPVNNDVPESKTTLQGFSFEQIYVS